MVLEIQPLPDNPRTPPSEAIERVLAGTDAAAQPEQAAGTLPPIPMSEPTPEPTAEEPASSIEVPEREYPLVIDDVPAEQPATEPAPQEGSTQPPVEITDDNQQDEAPQEAPTEPPVEAVNEESNEPTEQAEPAAEAQEVTEEAAPAPEESSEQSSEDFPEPAEFPVAEEAHAEETADKVADDDHAKEALRKATQKFNESLDKELSPYVEFFQLNQEKFSTIPAGEFMKQAGDYLRLGSQIAFHEKLIEATNASIKELQDKRRQIEDEARGSGMPSPSAPPAENTDQPLADAA